MAAAARTGTMGSSGTWNCYEAAQIGRPRLSATCFVALPPDPVPYGSGVLDHSVVAEPRQGHGVGVPAAQVGNLGHRIVFARGQADRTARLGHQPIHLRRAYRSHGWIGG